MLKYKIEDTKPEPNQYITAEVFYMGESQDVQGKVCANNTNVVLYDFYSGTAGANIIRWEPREPSRKNGHPWCGIENGG